MKSAITYRRNDLLVESVRLENLIRKVGTPVFVYSAGSILERFEELKRSFFGRKALICYAVKANPSGAVCRLLGRAGAGADVVSGGELARARRASIAPNKIVFSGVGKTREEMAAALRCGVKALNVESGEELEELARVAKACRKTAPVVVRVNPDVDAKTHRHITTGRAANKFGVARREAFALYRRAAGHRYLNPVGIQCHIGSQITKLAPYRLAIRSLVQMVGDLRRGGIILKHLDVGGGMGIDYGKESPFSAAEFGDAVKDELKSLPELEILTEPGRFLVGEAGVLVSKVLYRKRGGGKSFIVIDASMTELIRPALYGAQHEIVAVRAGRRAEKRVDVVGPVCETADTFAKGIRLPELKRGDLVAIKQAGAYGFSMSSQYNSRPRPPEVLVRGGAYRIVRKRETMADLIRHETE